jgi:cobalt/nickel transport system ATP-binding protein
VSAALEVRSLRYSYPDGTEALSGVSLSVEAGERVALIGPNGAGKTTLVLHLIGLLERDGGEVTVGGIALSKETAREVRRRVGVVFQDPDDQLFMTTVRQDVEFGPANHGVTGAELGDRVASALEAVGLAHAADRAPHHLSVGERRRAAIATVLAMEPEVVVLDEPSANLDPEGRESLAELLSGLGQTILMITHDLPYAAEVCDRALVMNAGRIVADGPIDRVLSDENLLAANRLRLPKGFGPPVTRGAEGDRR